LITIQVVRESTGRPASNIRVALFVERLFGTGMTSPEYTNDRGEAHFQIENCSGGVYVDGAFIKEAGSRLAGRMVVYI
jgi:hypothetical protein